MISILTRGTILESQIAIMMGGRVAEELFLEHMTTGAGNDIEQATELARRMVCDYGMSSLGPLTFGKREEQIFLGREIAQHRDYSEDTAIRIDQEIKRFVTEGYTKAKKILEENREVLCRIAENLLEREVLDANEVKMIIQNIPLEAKTALSQIQDLEPQSKRNSRLFSPYLPRFLLWWISSEKNRRPLSLCVSAGYLPVALYALPLSNGACPGLSRARLSCSNQNHCYDRLRERSVYGPCWGLYRELACPLSTSSAIPETPDG